MNYFIHISIKSMNKISWVKFHVYLVASKIEPIQGSRGDAASPIGERGLVHGELTVGPSYPHQTRIYFTVNHL
jgi:hypothetical protein